MDRKLADMTDVYWLEQVNVDLSAEDDWLSSAERTRLKSMRISKRQNDWRLGRWTAKRALAIYLDRPRIRGCWQPRDSSGAIRCSESILRQPSCARIDFNQPSG